MNKHEANVRFNEIKSAGLHEYTMEGTPFYGRCVYPKSFDLIGGAFGDDFELRILFSDGQTHREQDMIDYGLVPASNINLDGRQTNSRNVVDIYKGEEAIFEKLDLISPEEELERHNRIQRAKMGIIDEPTVNPNYNQQQMYNTQQHVQNNPVHLILDNVKNLEKIKFPIEIDIDIIGKDVFNLLKATFPDRALADVVSYFVNRIDTDIIKSSVDKSLKKFITEKLGEVYVEPVEEVEEVEISLSMEDSVSNMGINNNDDDDADVIIDGVPFKNEDFEKKN